VRAATACSNLTGRKQMQNRIMQSALVVAEKRKMSFKVQATISATKMGAATSTLTRQWPELIKYVPELKSCVPGTINVDLGFPVLVVNPQRTVPPFEWEPGHVEGFGMLDIQFEWPVGTTPLQAWVYLAHHSPHRYNMLRAEVITKEVPGLRGKTQFAPNERICCLHYPDFTGVII
jgi:hypothetical protein